MKVIFRTNIDAYQTNCFPANFDTPPRKGDKVRVVESFIKYYQGHKLPLRLEVVDVNWTEGGVVCELWYNKQDQEIAHNNGAKTL